MKKVVGIMFILLLLLSACEDSNNQDLDQNPSNINPIEEGGDGDSNDLMVVHPVRVEQGVVLQFVDWITNEKVIMIQHQNEESTIYVYDIFTGEKNPLFVTKGYFQLVEVNSKRDQILIETSSKENEANLIVLDLNSRVMAKTTIPSSEIFLDWNKVNPSQILITGFKEDWTYQSYIWDIESSSVKPIETEQPFIEWIGEDHLQYLDWQEEQPSLLASLKAIDYSTNEEVATIPDLHYTDSYGYWFFTLSPSNHSESKVNYSLYDSNYNPIGSFDVFRLDRYSQWLIPYYDYVEDRNEFYYLQPLEGGEADLYEKGFVLTSYNIEQGKSEVLLDGLENLPLECSPDGSYCLYGHQLEKVIILDQKEIIPLVKENEKADAT